MTVLKWDNRMGINKYLYIFLMMNIFITIPNISFGQEGSNSNSGNIRIESTQAGINDTLPSFATQGGKQSLKSDDESDQINTFKLKQNYPNPFNPETSISFTIDRKDQTSLKIYDISGKLTQVLVDRILDAGTYRFSWKPPASFPSGVYFYQLINGDHTLTRRMFLIR